MENNKGLCDECLILASYGMDEGYCDECLGQLSKKKVKPRLAFRKCHACGTKVTTYYERERGFCTSCFYTNKGTLAGYVIYERVDGTNVFQPHLEGDDVNFFIYDNLASAALAARKMVREDGLTLSFRNLAIVIIYKKHHSWVLGDTPSIKVSPGIAIPTYIEEEAFMTNTLDVEVKNG